MQYLSQQEGFLGLSQEDAMPPEQAHAVVIPFGLEASVSYGGGTAKGPQAMIDASHEVELFDDDFWCEAVRRYGVATLKEPVIVKPIEKALDQLASLTRSVLEQGRFPIVFGGEHSITPGAIRPFTEKYDDLAVLHFDAHADLRDGFEGEKFSHAAALRRVLDAPQVTKLVSIGIRNISATEIPYLEANKDRINIYWGRDRSRWKAQEIASHFKGRTVYLTFDLDGFDASLMPATGTPEPGGLFWQDAIDIIREVAKVSRIVGADVNELAPIDGFHASNFLAAKLAYKIMNYSLIPVKDWPQALAAA